METIAISEFKVHCLAVLERVRESGESVLVTRRGVPVAEVIPPTHPQGARRRLGESASATWHIVGDLAGDAIAPEDWEALSDL